MENNFNFGDKNISAEAKLSILADRLKEINNTLKVQGNNGNWNSDDYMLGYFNGLEFSSAVLEARQPKFRGITDKETKDSKDSIIEQLSKAAISTPGDDDYITGDEYYKVYGLPKCDVDIPMPEIKYPEDE